jgi:hypothetical protein
MDPQPARIERGARYLLDAGPDRAPYVLIVDGFASYGRVQVHFEGEEQRFGVEGDFLRGRGRLAPLPEPDAYDRFADWLAKSFGWSRWKRYLFEHRYSRADLTILLCAALLISHGYVLAGALLTLGGAIVVAAAERRL